MTTHDPVVIVAAKRTPTGNFNGQFVEVPAPQLGAAVIKNILAETSMNPNKIDGVYMGCVLPAGLGQAPARQAALAANLSVSTPCTTINKMCGSGMQALIMAHDALIAGSHKIMVAGGMENMSRAPYLLTQARQGYRMGHREIFDHMLLDGLEDAYDRGHHMGYFAEQCASEYKIDRAAQDTFAYASIQKARQAIQENGFKAEIAPVTVIQKKQSVEIDTDEGPFSVDPEKIPRLRPAFIPDGTITAANASSIADGAAALILLKRSEALQQGLIPIATVIGHFTHAQEPAQFSTAPIAAIQGLIKKIQWKLTDIDLFEINEAFAVVTLVAIQELKLNPQQVNVHGGACILGHPIGASGARILVTLIHALRQRQLHRGIAALCIGGGEATAVAIEV